MSSVMMIYESDNHKPKLTVCCCSLSKQFPSELLELHHTQEVLKAAEATVLVV